MVISLLNLQCYSSPSDAQILSISRRDPTEVHQANFQLESLLDATTYTATHTAVRPWQLRKSTRARIPPSVSFPFFALTDRHIRSLQVLTCAEAFWMRGKALMDLMSLELLWVCGSVKPWRKVTSTNLNFQAFRARGTVASNSINGEMANFLFLLSIIGREQKMIRANR